MGRLDYHKEHKVASINAGGTQENVFRSRVSMAAASTTLANLAPIPYDTIESETAPSWNVGLGRWVIPASITTNKRGHIVCNGNFNTNVYFNIYKNGAIYKYGSVAVNGNRETSMVPIDGVAGDYFEIRPEAGGGSTMNTVLDVNWAEMVIYKDADINGNGVILRSIATRTGGNLTLGSGTIKIPYNTIQHESVATYDTGLSRWVVPNTIVGTKRGYLSCNALFNGGTQIEIHVYKNGSLYKKGNFHYGGHTSVSMVPIECVATDYFEVFAVQTGGATMGIEGYDVFTWAEFILFADPQINSNRSVALMSEVNRNFASPVSIGVEPALFPYDNVVYENAPTFNISLSRWVIPASVTVAKKGYIFVNYRLSSGVGLHYIKVHKNGSSVIERKYGGTSTDSLGNSSIITISAVAGDYFEVKTEHSGSASAEGGIEQNWARLVLFNNEGTGSNTGNYLPTTNWEIGIPGDSVKQMDRSQWVQNGNVVTVWGSMLTKFDNPSPQFDITIPVTNGNAISNISGLIKKQKSAEQLTITTAIFGGGVRAGTHVGVTGSGIGNAANETYDFKFTYQLN